MSTLRNQVAQMMGDLGMPTISAGSQKILPSPTKQLARLVGFGDRIKVGDIVEVTTVDAAVAKDVFTEETPMRVMAIFRASDGSPRIQFRPFDDGPVVSADSGPIAGSVSGKGWRRLFRRLSPHEVSLWYEEARRLPDGTHLLKDHRGAVTIKDGVPIEIQRRSQFVQMRLAVEIAEQMSGFDLTVTKMYTDPAKTTVQVKKAARKQVSAILAGLKA